METSPEVPCGPMAGLCSVVVFYSDMLGVLKLFSFSTSSLIFWCSETTSAGTCPSQLDLYPWDHNCWPQVLVSTEMQIPGPEGEASCNGWQDPRADTAPLMEQAQQMQPSSHDLH